MNTKKPKQETKLSIYGKKILQKISRPFIHNSSARTMTPAQIAAEIKYHPFWYHDLELAEGVWTGQKIFHSTPASRQVFKNVDVTDAHVLDIGTMDGFFPILARRRGAGPIIASDRADYTSKIALVQSALRTPFEYVPDIGIDKLGEKLRQCWGRNADIVVFSGVLYHMFDPMAGLTRVRGLVRKGGIVIIETVAAITDEAALLYNDGIWIYIPGTYYVPTTGWLGSVLPFIGLHPIDCRYFVFGERGTMPLCRIAVCCRAVDIPVFSSPPPSYAAGELSWFRDYAKGDFAEFIDLTFLEKEPSSAIGYRSEAGFIDEEDPEKNSLRVESFFNLPGMSVDEHFARLGLKDLI